MRANVSVDGQKEAIVVESPDGRNIHKESLIRSRDSYSIKAKRIREMLKDGEGEEEKGIKAPLIYSNKLCINFVGVKYMCRKYRNLWTENNKWLFPFFLDLYRITKHHNIQKLFLCFLQIHSSYIPPLTGPPPSTPNDFQFSVPLFDMTCSLAPAKFSPPQFRHKTGSISSSQRLMDEGEGVNRIQCQCLIHFITINQLKCFYVLK